jgi:hypothetical protein
MLSVGAGANINTANTTLLPIDPGTFRIDSGTVQLTAPSGGTADELDAAELEFSGDDGANVRLTIVDSVPGTQGTVIVQGNVTLSAATTTTMNFSGTHNTADRLDVQNGGLTVAGSLVLRSNDGMKPTQPLNFFDDFSAAGTPSLGGTFLSITANVGNTYTGAEVENNPQLLYYQVTIK